MQFDPVHFQNKLGQTVLVRSALEEDAAPPLPDAGRLLRWKTGRDLFLCSRRPFPAVYPSL